LDLTHKLLNVHRTYQLTDVVHPINVSSFVFYFSSLTRKYLLSRVRLLNWTIVRSLDDFDLFLLFLDRHLLEFFVFFRNFLLYFYRHVDREFLHLLIDIVKFFFNEHHALSSRSSAARISSILKPKSFGSTCRY